MDKVDYIEYLIVMKQLIKEVERHVNERELQDAVTKAVEMSIAARRLKERLHEQVSSGVI